MVVDQPPVVETVVVNAARLPTSLADAAFSIVNVDPNALQTLPRLDQVLETSPGVSLFRRGSSAGANPTTQGVSLRSIGPTAAGRALVTLDGVPQNDPFGNWVIWTGIPTEALQGVSIVRGAGAGPYGSGALTGVIALDGRSTVDGGYAGDLSASDLGARRAALAGSDKIDGVQLFGAVSAEDGDHWIPVREHRGAADTPLTLEDWSATGKAVTDLGFAALTAAGGAYREARGSGTVDANSASKGQDGSLTLAAQPDATHLGWRLQGWVRESDLYNTSASVALDRSSATLSDSQYKTPALGWGANAAVRKLADWGSLEAGADVRTASGQSEELYSYTNGLPTHQRVAGGDTLQTGIYTEGAWRSGPWLLTGGARVDEWESTNGHRIESLLSTGAITLDPAIANRSGTVPTARAGLRRDWGDGFYTRVAGYEGFRAPSLNELYRPFRMGNNVTEANENLKPERLYGAEAAVGRDQGALTFNATVFVNQLKDPVANVTLGQGPATFPRAGFVPAGGFFIQRQNVGAINATGLEADAAYHLGAPLTLRLSGDYTDATVYGGEANPQITGKRPAQTPKLTLTGGGDWTVVERVVFSAAIRYEGTRFADDQNTLVLPAGATVDLRLDWQATKNFGVYIAAENLTDTALATDETANFIRSYDEPRVIRFGLRFRG
jgi:vitamin B12 transporter